MASKPVKYAVVDAFTESPFKGNPAAICLLEEARDEEWMQTAAKEFNLSETAYLIPLIVNDLNPRFDLRWFTPGAEVKLCGHATLASAHFLFSSGYAERSRKIEFLTQSGILTACKIDELKEPDPSRSSLSKAEGFSIQLDFPMIKVVECDSAEIPSLCMTLNGASIVSVKKTSTDGDLIVELSSGKAVIDLRPQFDEILKCAGSGLIITGPAPHGSGFDFFSRFFCPKLGVNEDPVCGSAHCALAPYWSKKLGKTNLIAYQASPRGGRLDLQLKEDTGRVLIQGKAVTVMIGTLLV